MMVQRPMNDIRLAQHTYKVCTVYIVYIHKDTYNYMYIAYIAEQLFKFPNKLNF